MTGKKRIFAGMGILLGVLVGVQGTAAYQSAYDKTENIITPGNVTSEIKEEFPTPPSIIPDKDIDITKKIWVSNNPSGKNQVSTDCYVRVSIGYSNSDIGKAVSLKNIDSTNWIYGDGGFYYYTKLVHEGESTTQLCSGFQIDHTKLESKYWKLLKEFQIQVYEESVEAEPFEDYREAWDYYTGEL